MHFVEADIFLGRFTQFLLSDMSWSVSHGILLRVRAFLPWTWENNKTSSFLSSLWWLFVLASILASCTISSWLGFILADQSSKSDIGVRDGLIRATSPISIFWHWWLLNKTHCKLRPQFHQIPDPDWLWLEPRVCRFHIWKLDCFAVSAPTWALNVSKEVKTKRSYLLENGGRKGGRTRRGNRLISWRLKKVYLGERSTFIDLRRDH